MSERIFRALMQLFAIIAKVDDVNNSEKIESSSGRKIIESFLKTELNATLVREYIKMFDEFLITHHFSSSKKDGERKRTSLNSVKVLRICSQINEELTQRQKMIVLLRIIEFIHSNSVITEQEEEFANTVAETFNIDYEEYKRIKDLIEKKDEMIDDSNYLYITSKELQLKHARQIVTEGFDKTICILRIESIHILFFKYYGSDELNMNGQIIPNDRFHIFNQGSAVKTSKSQAVYYSDIISRFLNDLNFEKIEFKVDKMKYHFKSGKIGLHEINFTEESGKLVGLMGGSGAGKSTLLNVLNGNYTPSSGIVTINGIDAHKEKNKLEGVIGFISQDDLLIEELSVFQNLYYNAKLCFNDLSDKEIAKKVIDLLAMIGLHEAMHLKVGSPLEKTISGGQRKRLNIALELIREPSVLFVDEPTSGLSSRDSENIMDLLKELALKGKLIFVVIHQPSSDIFKMFDRLILLDQGGYPIFDGNPIDAIVYFKKHVNHVNSDERECYACGNVNPEQIFNIIEAKVVDEYGNLTKIRKTLPEEWNDKFLEYLHSKTNHNQTKDYSQLKGNSKVPNRLKQFKVFFVRDILSKLSNKQYMLINMLEGPLLALILAFFVKFFNTKNNQSDYIFYENLNIPQYIFISVVVALFLGLTVAAEEIIKDKKILKRESFLNLSRSSYILSKLAILFIISAVQTLFFILIGNSILEIKGMWFEYWFILFSTSCVANVMGLNISSAFNSAKVIYITVPLLIIPQLLFSGVIVKFEKLHPWFSKANEVPVIGNVMVSRWAYEALIVVQAKDNKFQKITYNYEQQKSQSAWKRDYWIPKMKERLDDINNNKIKVKSFNKSKSILINEIKKEEKNWDNLDCKNCITDLEKIKFKQDHSELSNRIGSFLDIIKKQCNKTYNKNSDKIDQIIADYKKEEYIKLKEDYENESLHNLVINQYVEDFIIEDGNEYHQKDNSIYLLPKNKLFFQAHFYAPYKYVFGKKIDTFWVNMTVLWLVALFTVITLYYDWLKKFLDLFDKSSKE